MAAPEELLVFGYSCKLFRDDEKAHYIDQGKHLVPWMNDPKLLIDRFDVRGALYDLTDAESKGTDIEQLSEVEKREELICEQERYFCLYHDDNQRTRQEEEIKRIQVDLASDESYYNQVAFDYANYNAGDQQVNTQQENNQGDCQDSSSNFKPLAEDEAYFPPPELNVPNGMEVPQTVKQNKIIIKTAKFIVTHGAQMEIVIKTKQSGNSFFNFLSFEHPLNSYYKHVVFMLRMGKYKWEEEPEPETSKEQDSRYLHPDLSQSVRPDLTPGVSSPPKSSPHCSYSKLITKIREKQMATGWEDSEVSSPTIPSSPIPHGITEPTSDIVTPQPKKIVPNDNPISLVDYPSFTHAADGGSDIEDAESSPIKKSPLSKSNFLRMQSHDYSRIKWPPPELQMVIDKMASYITKNGSAFEEVVCNRNDPRFEFLKATHEFHPYYQCKLQLYNEVYGDFFKSSSKAHGKNIHRSTASNKKDGSYHNRSTANSRTISFSIKSREQEVSLSNNTTFPIESSTSEEDEEMEEEERERRRYEREQRRQARRKKEKEEKERKEQEEALKKEKFKQIKSRKKQEKVTDEETSGNEDLYDIFKYAQEMENEKSRLRIGSTDSSNRSQVKQLERKKKAAAFLSKINNDGGSKEKKTKEPAIYGPSLPPEIDDLIQSFSPLQSPSSRSSSEESSSKMSQASSTSQMDAKIPPPPPTLPPPLPPPPPTSKALPLGLNETLSTPASLDILNSSNAEYSTDKPKRSQENILSPVSSKTITGIADDSSLTVDSSEGYDRKSRSRRKHSRNKSSSRSPSRKKEKKKRKRSHGRSHHRKKQRSRSRSKSKGRSRSHRSSHHKKKSKHSSHKDRSKKKKHRKLQDSPSSLSSSSLSLSSTESRSPSSPSSLIFDSNSDADIQVIEQKDADEVSSRGSSVVSLPSLPIKSTNSRDSKEPFNVEDAQQSKSDESSSVPLKNSALSLITTEQKNGTIETPSEADKKATFDPSTSIAVAKITQGLRAKLQALLEK